jgi:hypothetical protein
LWGSSGGFLTYSIRAAPGDSLNSECQPALMERDRDSRLELSDDCFVPIRGELPPRLGGAFDLRVARVSAAKIRGRQRNGDHYRSSDD